MFIVTLKIMPVGEKDPAQLKTLPLSMSGSNLQLHDFYANY